MQKVWVIISLPCNRRNKSVLNSPLSTLRVSHTVASITDRAVILRLYGEGGEGRLCLSLLTHGGYSSQLLEELGGAGCGTAGWLTVNPRHTHSYTHSLMKRTCFIHTQTRSRTQAVHAQARLVWWWRWRWQLGGGRARAAELKRVVSNQSASGLWYKSTGTLRQQGHRADSRTKTG